MAAPTEGKVWAASFGGTGGAVVSTFLCWVLGVVAWGASSDASKATDAVSAVPAPVSALLILGITFGAAFAAGWLAKHAPRPVVQVAVDDLPADQPADPVVDLPADTAPVE